MSRVVAYDLTRMFLAPLSAAPRGIDRIDLAASRYFFADAAKSTVGILPTPWGIRVFDRARVLKGLTYLEKLWAEQDVSENEVSWAGLLASLAGQNARGPGSTRQNATRRSQNVRRMWGQLAATGMSFGQPVQSALPKGAIYLNIGQIGLAIPGFHKWIERRRDVTAIYMLHDVIPIQYPHFVEASSERYHKRMVSTAARHADGLIVSTDDAHKSILVALAALGRKDVRTCARKLPLSGVFSRPSSSHPDLANFHYFVTCSTIEPRKNHALLIDVWRRLAERLGSQTPHLVIAGSEGWQAKEILRPIREEAGLRSRVHHVSGLSTPALARLMLGCSAVLCPSMAEGFGLPLFEANALGIPTIASNIAAHREIANSETVLLPPDRPELWEAEILLYAASSARKTPSIPTEIEESAYCRDIAQFAQECALERTLT